MTRTALFGLLLFSLGCQQRSEMAPNGAQAVSVPARAPLPVAGSSRDHAGEPVVAPKYELDIRVAGTKTTWHKDVFDAVPTMKGRNRAGETRDAWSLRELAGQVAPGARVIAVHGSEDGKEIAVAEWNDPDRVPILHTNRRGQLKFRWARNDGRWLDSEVSDVVRLDIVR